VRSVAALVQIADRLTKSGFDLDAVDKP
jgi:hypothetical protein